jgi:hypothetical protein
LLLRDHAGIFFKETFPDIASTHFGAAHVRTSFYYSMAGCYRTARARPCVSPVELKDHLRHVSTRREFHYRVGWRSQYALPGYHHSSRTGAGHEFVATAPLLDYPDPRRLDIRRSARDPFEQLFVRTYNQRSLVPVYALVDLSGSMDFQGATSKLALLVEFLDILTFSTARTGDPFGLIACADKVLPDFVLPTTRNVEAVRVIVERLRISPPIAGEASGLIEAAPLIGYRRSLVFVLSDFHFPLDFTRRLLRALGRHDVVPIVLWDSVEFQYPPRLGIARVRDSETGAERHVLLRSKLCWRLRETFEQRRKTLEGVFVEFGYTPYFLIDRIDCDHLNQFFIER